MKKFICFKRARLSQLLIVFLLGVTFSVSIAYGRTLLQAKTLKISKPDIPVHVQPQAFSLDESLGHEKEDWVDSLSNQQAVGFTDIRWSTVKPALEPVGEPIGCVLNGKIYLFGGYLRNPFRVVSTVAVYDTENDTWKQLKNMPNPLTHSGTATVGADIYIAGGYVGKPSGGQIFATRNVWKYDTETDTWTAMPPLPQPRGGGAIEFLDGELHFFGGSDIKRQDRGEHWALSLSNLEQGWKYVDQLPNPANHLGSAVLNGKIYAIGGQRDQDAKAVIQTDVHEWNPTSKTWQTVAPLPVARSHISSGTFVMDGSIIVAGGDLTPRRFTSAVTAYNPVSNTWKELTPLPVARKSGIAGQVQDKLLFYATGYNIETYKGEPVLLSPSISRR